VAPHFSKISEIAIITWKNAKNDDLYHSYTTKMGPYLHFCPSKVAVKVQ